eukprot:1603489-Rhodomonas_salina.1
MCSCNVSDRCRVADFNVMKEPDEVCPRTRVSQPRQADETIMMQGPSHGFKRCCPSLGQFCGMMSMGVW